MWGLQPFNPVTCSKLQPFSPVTCLFYGFVAHAAVTCLKSTMLCASNAYTSMTKFDSCTYLFTSWYNGFYVLPIRKIKYFHGTMTFYFVCLSLLCVTVFTSWMSSSLDCVLIINIYGCHESYELKLRAYCFVQLINYIIQPYKTIPNYLWCF